jgi:PIN domain nuclease of toxin-antitoxin system
MKYLLDTHAFLWFVSGSTELNSSIINLIKNPNNNFFISIASLWEISIKTSLNKLNISGSYSSVIDDVVENNIEILPINFMHTVVQNKLPFHHRDPFDRMLISQAIVENMPIISRDSIFDRYLENKSIQRIW